MTKQITHPKIPLSVKKKNAASKPPIGSVTIQERMIFPMTRKSIAPMPRASPTPMTAPTRMWVVDTGMPVPEASTTVAAAASSAALEAYLSNGLLRHAKGAALFSRAGDAPFFLPLQFYVPLPNWIAVDSGVSHQPHRFHGDHEMPT